MNILEFLQSNMIVIIGVVIVVALVVMFTTKEHMTTDDDISNLENEYVDEDVFGDAPMYEEINRNVMNVPLPSTQQKTDVLSSFYEDNLQGEGDDFDMDNERNSRGMDNIDADYTLGVNMEDTENKGLGVIQNANKLKSSDLLPKEKKDWFDTPQVGKTIEDANLLADATFRIGLDTVVTKRGMTTDPRGSIHVPKINVSPWNQSSRDPNPTSGWCN